MRSRADYVYGYGPALDDGVVRPVIFLAYSGEMRWRSRAGDEITGTLGTPMTPDQLAYAWRTALDPDGEWVARVLEAADRRLTEVRRGMPDAGGLVIAGDHADARAYAALLRKITGTRPVVVLSDDPAASKKIGDVRARREDRWMVAVRMVSEGVDIPRLAVGVYATSVSTALFFAQAVGRFVRVRHRGETASVFLPSIPLLLGLRRRAGGRARSRAGRRADDDGPRSASWPRRSAAGTPPTSWSEAPFQALEASAHFDRALYDGGEFGTSAEEDDFLGLPGLLEPEQVTPAAAQAPGRPGQPRTRPGGSGPEPRSGAAGGCRCRAGRAQRRTRPPRPGAAADRRMQARPAPAGVGQGEPGRAAQGAERAGHGLAPPDRPAARASSTPSCAGPAADRRCRRPPAPSSASASTRCAGGRRPGADHLC